MREARATKAIDIETAQFPALVKHTADVVRQRIAALGIPDKFVVKIKGGTTGSFDQRWVGMYRGETQFRGHGAIFWINANLPKMVAADYNPDYDGTLSGAIYHVVLTTLYHEYAHVIEEYARYHKTHVPELNQLITANFSDREDFTEEFGRFFAGGVSHFGMETFGPIIEAWIKVLTEPDTEADGMNEAALLERTETIDILSRGGNHLTVRLHWNPSPQALLNLVKRSEDHEQRGLLVDANTAVFWDSWYAEHDRIAQWLNQQGYDVSMDGSSNMVVDARTSPPSIYADDLGRGGPGDPATLEQVQAWSLVE